ncbi:hypothetical protein GMOD_00002670 [Pyrenophora seminiperda CCB06]|uniref:Uncharacterized protein n=1 Tax=Pyrenophora seminiperda CCB06 TaxID=1302712 RepID=A0A3M7M332_9PLEO|nr:hypothetical protein GMOD_00002670 [Pyrenophora seminiperda CCB06]
MCNDVLPALTTSNFPYVTRPLLTTTTASHTRIRIRISTALLSLLSLSHHILNHPNHLRPFRRPPRARSILKVMIKQHKRPYSRIKPSLNSAGIDLIDGTLLNTRKILGIWKSRATSPALIQCRAD